MTDSLATDVQNHYSGNDLLHRIVTALQNAGTDIEQLSEDDLAAVDHFHTRGRQSTEELADLATRGALTKPTNILDVGSGIGGTARFLSSKFGCHVTGVDLSSEYVETAQGLSKLVAASDRTYFVQGSATALPFGAATFELVWTEHVQMNISDKQGLIREVTRVLKPSGRFVFHDVFAAAKVGELKFPVPWADQAKISHLISSEEYKEVLNNHGFKITDWREKASDSTEAFTAALERMNNQADNEQPTIGLHFLMGRDTRQKITNYLEGLRCGAVTVAMGVAELTN